MRDDDMSFMEPVFMERKLPFAEYIVSSGYHALSQEILNKQAFRDSDAHDPNNIFAKSALGEMQRKYGNHYAATYSFPCKGGASISVSVICGNMFYSRPDAPYEILGVGLDDGDDGGEPMAYQTDEQLMIYLAKVLAHAQEY